MTNEEKADLYHNLLLQHDKLDGKVADIKAEAAGMTLNEDQKNRLNEIENKKSIIVEKAQSLFHTYRV
jgi:hypothetical protein